MQAPCVWITRTEPGASRLETELAEAGYRVFKQPLLEIEPLGIADLEQRAAALVDCDICIVLSAHAARLGVPLLEKRIPDRVRWLAVGAGTARALEVAGIDAQRPALESSEGILATEALRDVEGLQVGLLCGEGGRELLGDELRRRGAEVTRVEVYRRVPVAVEPAWLARRVAEVSVVLVASVEAGESLMRLVDVRSRVRLSVLSSSERIAATLHGAGFDQVSVTEGADDEAMLQGLRAMSGAPGDREG